MMLVLSFTLSAHTQNDIESIKSFKPPVKLLSANQWPRFSDDLLGQEMQLALFRQIRKFKSLNLNHSIQFDQHKFSSNIIPASILAFQKFFNEWKDCITEPQSKKVLCNDQLNQRLKRNFNLYRPKDQDAKKASLFTAYYTPTIEAKLHPEGDYQWGIYRRPQERKLLDYDRIDIDFKKKLQFSAYDLFYTKDLFDNYVLQIQGGGRLKIINENGVHYQYISYEGTNGKRWRYISKYMKKKGYIKNLSNASQKRFLNANPNKWEEIYSYCPSYVFFRPTEHPPLGSELTPLTNGRSIATDNGLYAFKGGLSFIQGSMPFRDENGSTKFKRFNRFFIDHDTGGSIKGNARADLFMGEDAAAEFAANNFYSRGNMFFLVLKPEKKKVWLEVLDRLKTIASSPKTS